MNKKFKLIIVAILIIQLLMPVGLLTYHYTLHSRAMTESPEFRFKLDGMDIYDIYDTGEGVERLCFDVIDIFQLYNEDIAVTVGEDGYAHMLPSENKKLNKHWFTFEYYYNKSYVNNDSYVYEDGINVAELHRKINKIYGKDIEKPDGFYVTAKVYRGIFIPLAIYIEDTKVISFLQNS